MSLRLHPFTCLVHTCGVARTQGREAAHESAFCDVTERRRAPSAEQPRVDEVRSSTALQPRRG